MFLDNNWESEEEIETLAKPWFHRLLNTLCLLIYDFPNEDIPPYNTDFDRTSTEQKL